MKRPRPSASIELCVLGAAVLLLVLVSFAPILPSAFLAAQLPGARPGSTVRVIKSNDNPRVWLESLRANEKVVAAESCVTKEVLERYYDNSVQKYRAHLAQKAACHTGYMTASVLDMKIADASGTIGLLEYLIDILKKTRERLAKANSLDGLQILGVPSAIPGTSPIEYAAGIAPKCVLGPEPDEKRNEVMIGKAQYIQDPIYARNYKEAKAAVAKIIKTNEELTKKIEEETKDGKAIGVFTIISMVNQVMAMKNELQNDLIPVYPEFVEKEIKAGQLKEMWIGLGIDFAKENDKPQVVTGIPWAIKKLMGGFGIDGPLYNAGLGIGNEEKAFSYGGIAIPEHYVLKDILNGIEKKIKEFESAKARFEAKKRGHEKELAALEKNDYNCSQEFDPKDDK